MNIHSADCEIKKVIVELRKRVLKSLFSPDVPDDGANVDSLKAEKTSDGPSAFSEEDRQKLLASTNKNTNISLFLVSTVVY